jgi:hypothetical protein
MLMEIRILPGPSLKPQLTSPHSRSVVALNSWSYYGTMSKVPEEKVLSISNSKSVQNSEDYFPSVGAQVY